MDTAQDIWDSLKDTVDGGDYRLSYPPDVKKKRSGTAKGDVYYGKDGKEYVRKKPLQYENEKQRRFIMATRRGASQDPEFTADEASAFIHGVKGS